MKKMRLFSVLLFAAAMLVSCDTKTSGEAEEEQDNGQYQVDYFGFQEEEDGLWGLMATDGTVLVKPKFQNYISAVVNDRFYVNDDDEYTIYTAEKNPKKIGTYKNCGSFTGDLCPVQDMNDHILYIDKDGEKVLNGYGGEIKGIGIPIVSKENYSDFCNWQVETENKLTDELKNWIESPVR